MDIEKIKELIISKEAENDWLDYKQEWHNNKINLIRDILAFVNTPHHKDCYLIFGIEDKTFEIIGVQDDKNRKNTQQLTDLLNRQKFSVITPKIKVETIEIEEKTVDIITIFNTADVPVYLTEEQRYKEEIIRVGQIFTRISDTNTPKNETARIEIVEALFRKRFKLDQTVLDRFKYLLEQVDDWSFMDDEGKLIYNYNPNFYILIKSLSKEEKDIYDGDYFGWLANSDCMINDWKIDCYKSVFLMYGNHIISEISYLFDFDSGRGCFICPIFGEIGKKTGNREMYYNYFIKDSIPWKFMMLYVYIYNKYNPEDFYEHHYPVKTILENIVIYENEKECQIIEDHFSSCNSIIQFEQAIGLNLQPTQEELQKLADRNKRFGKYSLLQNNIGKSINQFLKGEKFKKIKGEREQDE